MKYILTFAVTILLCVGAYAQHSLQADDGAGNIAIIKGPTSGGSNVYTLPPGGGTLLTGSIEASTLLSASPTAPSGYTYTGASFRCDSIAWSSRAAMPTARACFGTAVSRGMGESNNIYAIGGFNGANLTTNECYDRLTNTWATRAPMPTARRELGCATVNGRIYAVMGTTGGMGATLNIAEEYNPATNTWAAKATHTSGMEGFGCVTLNGRVYVIGGGAGIFSSVAGGHKVYDAVFNFWSDLSVSNSFVYFTFQGCAATVVKDKIYMTGNEFSNPQNLFEIDLDGNRFIKISTMPTKRRLLSMATIGDDIYCMGGTASYTPSMPGYAESALDVVEIYNVRTGSWRTGPSLPTAVWGAGSAVVDGRIYVVGGYTGSGYSAANNEMKIHDKELYLHAKN